MKYLTLAGDYGNAFFGGTSYTNEFSEYCFNFWQYIDYYAPGTARLRLPHPLSCGMRKASGRVPTIGKDGSLSLA